MSDASPEAPAGIDWGALAHAIAGSSAVILGGLMYTLPWAQDVFALLMIVAAVSAVYFSWKHAAWVTGHGAGDRCGCRILGMGMGLHACLCGTVVSFYPFRDSRSAVVTG